MTRVCVIWALGLTLLVAGLAAVGEATVTRNVNLRPTASTAGTAIRLLKPPEVLTVLEPTPTAGFYHVTTSQGEEGWVWAKNVTLSTTGPPATGSPGPPPAATPVAGTNLPGGEAVDSSACPAEGITSFTGNQKIDDEQRNLAKRHIPADGTPAPLTLADFVQLETDVDTLFHVDPTKQEISIVPDRHLLRALATTQPAVTLSEGDRVQIAGYVNKVRPGSSESVNCGTADGADIHINIGPKGGTEYDGIVVEVIPQWPAPKAAGWVASTLEHLSTSQVEVLAVGGLTLDNAHKLNNDAAHPISSQPARLSMWEVHPVVEFFVCAKATCDAANHGDWTPLSAWPGGTPDGGRGRPASGGTDLR